MRQMHQQQESDIKLTAKRALILVVCSAGTAFTPPPFSVFFGILTSYFLVRNLRFLAREWKS